VRHASRGSSKWGLYFTGDSPVTTPARARPAGDWLKNSAALRSVAAADRHALRGVPGDWLSDSDFRWRRMIWCATRRRRASSARRQLFCYVRTHAAFYKCQRCIAVHLRDKSCWRCVIGTTKTNYICFLTYTNLCSCFSCWIQGWLFLIVLRPPMQDYCHFFFQNCQTLTKLNYVCWKHFGRTNSKVTQLPMPISVPPVKEFQGIVTICYS